MNLARRSATVLLALGLSTSLVACGDDSSRDRAAVEGSWALVEFDALDIDANPTVATTLVLEGGKATGNGGVNAFTGTYDAPEDGKISFSELSSTKMAGEPAAMEQEARFLSEIAKVENFEYDAEDSELELKDDKDDTLLVLVAVDAPS
jgi:heat shock protein HslJ